MPKSRKRRKKSRQPPSPLVIAQRKQKAEVRSLFRRAGFTRIKADGIHFQFMGRTGEFDDVFAEENILILTEYTVGQPDTAHFAKKNLLYDLILDSPADWVTFFSGLSAEFKEYIKANSYDPNDFRIKILYCPRDGISDEIDNICPRIYFFEAKFRKYFLSLSKTISKSARFELFKYFDLNTNEVGENVFSSSTSAKTFVGYLLPERFSNFPTDYKVVSFYADPESLLERCFVLRADSWRDPESLYQRMLIPKKIRAMRRYLDEKERVFVNNVIVSLPSDTTLNDPTKSGRNLLQSDLANPRAVEISVPDGYNKIGIIDGQHRIFCYHEGADTFEPKIARLRTRQNLLVTGIVYPQTDEKARQKFEATLFLEINDEQTRAKSELKQGIEVILRPASNMAIAKAVVQRLSDTGPLKGHMKAHYFDEKTKIKTTSIVSYGLRPLVKFEGTDCLFSVWKSKGKAKLSAAKRSDPPRQLLEEYIDHCVQHINDFLVGAKTNIEKNRWQTPNDGGILTPTMINGFIVCIRALTAKGKLGSIKHYQQKLHGLNNFQFSRYKSSHWKDLGLQLAQQFFGVKT